MDKIYAHVKNLKYYEEDFISIYIRGRSQLLYEINDYLREIGEFSFLFHNEYLITKETAIFHISMKYDQIGF